MHGLIVKLTSTDESIGTEFIKVNDIQRMIEVKEKMVPKGEPKVMPHTLVYLLGCDVPIEVKETVGMIMQLCTQHSNALQWVKQ